MCGFLGVPGRLCKPALVLSTCASLSVAFAAGPLPQNGHFVAGAGGIASCPDQITITQSTPRGVIDWNSFSIGAGNNVKVNNGSGATLSRVTGSSASTIDGNLSATGSFYLINPQGVVIGRQGVVTTGGRFVASALDTSNDGFMAGGPITLSGASKASVVNLGRISSSGGDVFLISLLHTENEGRIAAPHGTAELVTGKEILLKDSTTGTQVFVQPGGLGDVVNGGIIRAAQIHLEAADGNVYALAGRHAAMRATGTATRDGHVWLVARQGDVQQHERITATNSDGTGGTVDTTGKTMEFEHSTVTASEWNIGVDKLNAGPHNSAALSRSLSNGTSVTINAGSDINMLSTLRWTGDASLSLSAGHSILLGPMTTLSNTGAGNLLLRADSKNIDNNGSVTNTGTIDWSKSTGIVAVLYDSNGRFAPGTIRTNVSWAAAPFSGLKTQVTAYQLVNSIDELEKISQNLGGNYALGKDLSANSPFTPIGIGSTTGFTGQFDGFGHTIDGIDVSTTPDSNSPPLGTFSTIGASGVVRNVNLTNAYSSPWGTVAGLLAGSSAGLVANVSVKGEMSTEEIGAGAIGGVVGDNSGTISRATSNVSMYAQGSMGGIALSNSGLIVQSSASGDYGGGTHAHVGGIAAGNGGVIRQSYATGSGGGVTDGGLTEYNGGRIEESFAAISLPTGLPPGYVGGIASTNAGTVGKDVYWDRQVTGQTVGAASGTPIPASNGLTTAQMGMASSFGPTWNFAPGGTWTFVAGVSHPVLQWQVGK
ncbi:filamentous hemagglutinin N-terminal domain-containing protein [Caballeronia sp. LZ062]|uniref:two-partner secretion domain-containing protein n=1 Tax=unclassified Caballeronia TaxID=2646786 RepID=UPI00285DFD3A|nr:MULTISPECIES: filamentous hemagglutinin N-terminal domain-containing protein [unclassified Caballeronia]MDR5856194.1 filamentous hemagglutinin N-terminal domain-containing protein [Caballeronia sp. LZ050]MDR5872865.1 filamentous hemagglutinin N-terminal domain-containing protein [Caballeronia sp. LZ062]